MYSYRQMHRQTDVQRDIDTHTQICIHRHTLTNTNTGHVNGYVCARLSDNRKQP